MAGVVCPGRFMLKASTADPIANDLSNEVTRCDPVAGKDRRSYRWCDAVDVVAGDNVGSQIVRATLTSVRSTSLIWI